MIIAVCWYVNKSEVINIVYNTTETVEEPGDRLNTGREAGGE